MSGIEKHNSCIGVRGLYVAYFKTHHGKQICSIRHIPLRGRQYSGTYEISTTIKFSHLANNQVTQKAEPHRTIFRSLAHLRQRWARLSAPQSLWLKESDK